MGCTACWVHPTDFDWSSNTLYIHQHKSFEGKRSKVIVRECSEFDISEYGTV
jgi:hypothetical protein